MLIARDDQMETVRAEIHGSQQFTIAEICGKGIRHMIRSVGPAGLSHVSGVFQRRYGGS
jgi:hypothetical protein